jgi:hypothetical protein
MPGANPARCERHQRAVSQAHLLRDRLTALTKVFEIQIFPDREHGIGPQNLYDYSLDFLKRKLSGEAAKK